MSQQDRRRVVIEKDIGENERNVNGGENLRQFSSTYSKDHCKKRKRRKITQVYSRHFVNNVASNFKISHINSVEKEE